MGEKLRNITGRATDLINPGIKLCCDMKSCGNSELHSLLSLQKGVVLSTSEYIAGTILAIILFIILFSIISYGLSIMSVGETIILTILKKKSNDDNLLEHSDEDGIEDEENDENGDQETEKNT